MPLFCSLLLFVRGHVAFVLVDMYGIAKTFVF